MNEFMIGKGRGNRSYTGSYEGPVKYYQKNSRGISSSSIFEVGQNFQYLKGSYSYLRGSKLSGENHEKVGVY